MQKRQLTKSLNNTNDPHSERYQLSVHNSLAKTLNGLINRLNADNIREIVVELFSQNLLYGKGLLVKSLIRSQQLSPSFTPVYAATIAVLNSKLPDIGLLIIKRLIHNFKDAQQAQNKLVALATCKFLAHLINQSVSHDIIALQVLAQLLKNANDDNVEVAVQFMKECGATLSQRNSKATSATFDQFRQILHDSDTISQRVLYSIEELFQIRKDGFKQFPSIAKEDLDLVEAEDQHLHFVTMDDDLDLELELDDFRFDSDFVNNQLKFQAIKKEILGDDDADSQQQEVIDEAVDLPVAVQDKQSQVTTIVQDMTEAETVSMRRKIYLTIMSSLDFEEACHKLLKIKLAPGQDQLLCSMVIECCSQETSYEKFYGLLGERLCKIQRNNKAQQFANVFRTIYATIHRYETNRIRNIAQFYAHLLHTDAVSWKVFDCVRLTEDDTTSSSRIYLKILFQQLVEALGKGAFKARLLHQESTQQAMSGLFPLDTARNVRFAINYWTSIGLGVLTDDLREYLKEMPLGLEDSDDSSETSEDSDDEETDSSFSEKNEADEEADSASVSSLVSSSLSITKDMIRKRRRVA